MAPEGRGGAGEREDKVLRWTAILDLRALWGNLIVRFYLASSPGKILLLPLLTFPQTGRL